jgi:hypothetical protein
MMVLDDHVEASVSELTTIGLNIAKWVLHALGVNASGATAQQRMQNCEAWSCS